MANLFAVPNFIKATSPQGLRRLMYQVQIKDRMQYVFFDISFVSGYWHAWYFYEPKTDTDKVKSAQELTKKGSE
jgi:ribosomal protein S6